MLAPALSLLLALAAAATPPPSIDSSPADPDAKARAREAFAAGKDAAGRGAWAEAIEHFERALALRPAPSLHYNIAVCHHNRMLEAGDDAEAAEAERRAAVDAYVRYLDAAKDASDRAEVEAAIEQLGGRPEDDAGETWVIERIEPDTAPALALRDDDAARDDDTTTPTPSGPRATADARPIGRVGPFVPVSIASPLDLSHSDTMRILPGIGLGVRGGAFVTRPRTLNLGGELWMTGQPVDIARNYSLLTSVLAFVAEYGQPIAEGKVELGGGGGLGVVVQSLRYRGTSSIACPVTRKALSTRGGLLAHLRMQVAAVLGRRGQHELSLRLSPGIAFYGPGAKSDDADMMCDDLDDGFTAVGLSRRAALVLSIDLGYSPRF